jgi:hypothetical protein
MKTECFNSDGQFSLMSDDGDDLFFSVYPVDDSDPHPNRDGAALSALAQKVVAAFNAWDSVEALTARIKALQS